MEGPSQDNAAIPEALVHCAQSPSVSSKEIKDLLEAAKNTLPVPFRLDGPPLGFTFDPVPVDRRVVIEGYGKPKKMVIGDYDAEAAEDGSIQGIRKRQSWTSGQKRKALLVKPLDSHYSEFDHHEAMLRLEGQLRIDKETEKEIKKRERKLQKEQERQYREQQKEMEKQQKVRDKKLKAQMKEEEKQKQQLEKDMKKLERDLERERKAEERKRQQEVKRREKDLQKALAAQVKVAQKELQKELAAGPPDDLDLEMDKMMKEMPATPIDDDCFVRERPPFPPPSLELESAFPQLGNKIGGDVIMIWGFVQSFSDIIALPPFSIAHFIAALQTGQTSALLSNIHIILIRLIQADMEESHHLGSGGTSNFMDRAVVGIAGTLDEAVSWGFDVDAWRAHLNQFTWPEILRQLAIAAGYGAKRSRGLRDKYQKSTEDTEDAIGEESRAGYGLKMPSRLTQGTVKAAAWQVLSEVGPEGLTISEIATRIQKQGLRDLRTSKTPEATVAGALSRDAVFCRVAPATYALHAMLPTPENPTNASSAMEGTDPSLKDEVQGDASVHEMETNKFIQGEAWIPLLSNNDYDTLTLEQKLEVLKTLCNMALESPTIRACLETRLEREIAEQKRLDLEAKAEKRARREQAAEEAQRKLLELENSGAVETHENLDSKVKDLMTESMQTVVPDSLQSALYASTAQDHVRFEPLGRDRRFNRYWNFLGDEKAEDHEGSAPGHLFIEVNGQFKVLKSTDHLYGLLHSLERRGAREGPLYSALGQYKQHLQDEWPVWKEQDEAGDAMDVDPASPCDSPRFFAKRWARTASLDKQLREQTDKRDWLLQLKIQMTQMNQALACDTKPEFNSVTWTADVENATSLDQLVVCLGRFEFALSHQVLHSNYTRTPQILYGAWSDMYDPDTIHTADGFLSWVPRSFAAAFLHLLTLDAALTYHSGAMPGREVLLAYKYVQKPFVQELNSHLDVPPIKHTLDNTSQIVSVEPIRPGGKLQSSSFPVLQKGAPVYKRPLPFSFQVEKVREDVDAAERNGTLYANIQLTKGRNKSSGKQNGSKGVHSLPSKRYSELEDEVSTSGMLASTDEAEAPDDEYDDETIGRSEMSRDDADDDEFGL